MQDLQDAYAHPGGVLSPSLWDDEWLNEPLKRDAAVLSNPSYDENFITSSPLPNDVDMLWMERSMDLEFLTELPNVTPHEVMQLTSDTKQDIKVLPENQGVKKGGLKSADEKDFLKVEGIEDLLHDFIDEKVYIKAEPNASKCSSPVPESDNLKIKEPNSPEVKAEIKNLLHDYAGKKFTKQATGAKNATLKSKPVKRLETINSNKVANAPLKNVSSFLVSPNGKPMLVNVDAIVHVKPVSQQLQNGQIILKSLDSAVSDTPAMEITTPQILNAEETEKVLPQLQIQTIEELQSEESPIEYLSVPILQDGAVTLSSDASYDFALESVDSLNRVAHKFKPILPKLDEPVVVDFLENLLLENQSASLYSIPPIEPQPPEIIITIDPDVYVEESSTITKEEMSPVSMVDSNYNPSTELFSPGESVRDYETSNFDSDSDYVPASSPRRRTKRSRLSPDMKKLRKKEQNKNAAIRYREKKRDEHKDLSKIEAELTEKNTQLKQRLNGITAEIKYLKDLFLEIYESNKTS